MRILKRKREIRGDTEHPAADLGDSSQVNIWTWECLLAVSSLINFSPEATKVSKPEEHFAFPQMSSS